MNSKSEMTVNGKSLFVNIISCLFGILAMAIGFVNIFWGNDAGYGIFVLLLSTLFFPPVTGFIRQKIGINIPWYLMILLALFIIWSAIGVGELPAKVDMMMSDFSSGK